MVILTVHCHDLLGLLLFLSGQEERILWDCFSESQRKLQRGKVSLFRAELGTEATDEMSCVNKLRDTKKLHATNWALWVPRSSWSPGTTLLSIYVGNLNYAKTVLSEQTHPWERAWDEPVSSNQSCTKSKGKATPASKGQSLLSNHFVFSFKGTNCVASDFSSWISTCKNTAMSCQENTTSTQKYYVIFPHWMTADYWPEDGHKQHCHLL